MHTPDDKAFPLMISRTQRLLVALGLLVSALFLWFAFSRLNPAAMWAHIQHAAPLPILLGALVYFGAVTVISLRWRFLLRSIRPVPLRRLIPLVSIGYMGNNVYPFRSGEVLRVWLLQRNEAVPIARAATTAAIERVFDGLVMLTFIVVSLLLLPDIASSDIHHILVFAAPVFLVGILVFFVLAARPNLLRRLVEGISRLLPARLRALVLHLADEVLAGLDALRTPADLAGTIVTSYLSWMIEASVYWIVSFAFNLEITYVHALLVVGVVNLAGLIPASPGQLGVFEFFASTVLIAAGIGEARATAYALVVHAVIWLPVTLVGFYFLARQGLNWSALGRARRHLDSGQPLAAGK